ncbi:MAG: hypothetical protein ACC619_08745 [Paracoccaceae bacterium]
MELVDTLADDLAKETLEAVEKSGNEKLVREMADVIGASSPTMEEAFLTAIRVRRAERRARDMLALFNARDRKLADQPDKAG